jgi:hypothetical protein
MLRKLDVESRSRSWCVRQPLNSSLMKLGGKSEHHRAKRLACLPGAVSSASGLESGGSAGNILQKRKVSQKTFIPFFSKEEIERKVKRWCKRPPHRQK